ncbi:hypothetical protein TgHK011_006023 [Trichoderma gracile]|nr:hypothetical protein TgHK011_006023 [Trichoderma gracile]
MPLLPSLSTQEYGHRLQLAWSEAITRDRSEKTKTNAHLTSPSPSPEEGRDTITTFSLSVCTYSSKQPDCCYRISTTAASARAPPQPPVLSLPLEPKSLIQRLIHVLWGLWASSLSSPSRPFVIVRSGTQGLAARFTEPDDAKAILPQRRNEGILPAWFADDYFAIGSYTTSIPFTFLQRATLVRDSRGFTSRLASGAQQRHRTSTSCASRAILTLFSLLTAHIAGSQAPVTACTPVTQQPAISAPPHRTGFLHPATILGYFPIYFIYFSFPSHAPLAAA